MAKEQGEIAGKLAQAAGKAGDKPGSQSLEQAGKAGAMTVGGGYRLLRSADWQEGIALPAADHTRSVTTCARQVRHWAMREPGSAARECLDDLLGKPHASKRIMLSHQAVVEAVRATESDLAGRGRVLLRPSGTEPVVRVMVEGDDAARVRRLAHQLAEIVAASAAD